VAQVLVNTCSPDFAMAALTVSGSCTAGSFVTLFVDESLQEQIMPSKIAAIKMGFMLNGFAG